MCGLTTTLGILGTFGGIFLGLMGFDVQDIPGSVPRLLDGLKTAFLTSIAGMVAALVLKEAPVLYGIRIPKEDSSKEEATIEVMVKHLAGIEKNQREIFDRESEQLIKIEKALCGEGDTTLLTQIQKLRTSFADKQDELIKSFNEFAQNMTENNSKSLIDALTQVMKDFNAKINEQFGDNFKHLNEAVGKILEWQQEYGRQVEAMIHQIQTAASAVEQSDKTLSLIVSKADSFSNTAQDLQRLLSGLEQIKNDISNHLGAFEQLATNARSAFPIIDEQLKKLTRDFSNSVEQTISDSRNIVKLQLESTRQLNGEAQIAQRALNDSLTQMVTNLNQNIERMMRENAERITQQITQLDKELGEELTKSLRTLGSQLASLSGKFVEDYTPLTDKLRKIVEMAQNIPR